MSRSRAFRGLIAGAAVTVSAGLLAGQAAGPAFWRVSTQADFLRGDADNVSIDADGRLLLGPNATVVRTAAAPFLWTVVRSGGALWTGGGADEGVVRVTADGAAETLFTPDDGDVHALAADGAGGVYAAASPGGRVVTVAPDGVVRTVVDLEEPYVWALAASPDGVLHVGTGNPGRIYRVSPDGSAVLVHDTGATHVRTLAFDGAGRLIAGTGAPGRVLRIDADGRAFVLLDPGQPEITSVRPAPDGAIVALAAGPVPAGAGASAAAGGSSTGATVSVTVTASASAAPPPAASIRGAPGGAIYRIAPDGIWDLVWQSAADTPYDAALAADDTLIVGTGPAGRIFRVALADPAAAILLTRAPVGQVTRLAAGPDDRIHYTTANPGALYRLATDRAGEGAYRSDVLDARTVAAWGVLRWRAHTPAGSAVRLFTRSGNTSTPGETWSRWSAAYDDPSGDAIRSPAARYLQWKAVLRSDRAAGAPPVLHSVTAAYLPRNLAPEITEITVHPPGMVYQQALAGGNPPIAGLDAGRDPAAAPGGAGRATPTLGQQVYRRGLRTLAWEARDPNDDRMQFEVWYRREEGTEWRALRRALSDRLFTWDTTSTPDGTYVARIIASDAASNAPGQARQTRRDTPPFDVDNTPPRIDLHGAVADGGRSRVSFTVSDTQSVVTRVEYTLDAARWQVVYPIDGIPDTLVERFEVSVPAESRDRLVVRATDAMDNTVSAGLR